MDGPVRTAHPQGLLRVAHDAFARRRAAGLALAGQSHAVARACRDVARRFADGGTLIAFGAGASASDAHHLAVEFLHPVIVGKRALPAIALTTDAATLSGIASEDGWDAVFSRQLRTLASGRDIAVALSASGRDDGIVRGLETARALGLLTVALVADGGPLAMGPAVDHRLLAPGGAPTVVKEVEVTAYHVLWELVHVFLEHPDAPGAEPGA